MCLDINPKRKNTFVPLRVKYGYKVVCKYTGDVFYPQSFYGQGQIGQIYKSDRRYKRLTKIELECGEVYKGIHVYTNLDTAQQKMSCNYRIVKVALDPKYFIARSISGNEAAYTRVMPVGFIT
jgi:hypothetical protein